MPLSDTAIRKAKPAGKPLKLADGGGLYLLLKPDGARWWRWDYRRPVTGKRNTLSLGTYPDTGLADARERQAHARKLLAAGIDPGEQRKAEKAATQERTANTFAAVAAELLTQRAKKLAAGSVLRERRLLESNLAPYIGERPIASVSAPELLAALRKVEARGAVETAHRARMLASLVFRYAIATGRAKRNPAADLLGALSQPQGTHFASLTEPADVAPLLRALHGYQGTPVVNAALKLAPLFFVRPGELRRARWADIDLDAAEWRYTASKTGTPHIVPLATQAVEILRELHPLTGRGEYVFPGMRGRDRAMSENTVNAAMRRMGFDGDTMTGHGFRAMARTILDEVLGYRPDYIEHQLAHAVRDPKGRAYNRTAHLPERRKMMQGWADYLDSLRTGGNVVPLRAKAG
ncbi:integrase arm-type DNA-binding domain-containing protein [Xanthomonas campestris pv. raphani]|uniref:tyrosine-type recombinase/integrase n=1 Tax=Xanthomonas campestris TaxID=339 RepID=UPI002B22B023|nr:integrase arm-type DNA-binding domain-containing protein [Xanthomonas campestris]MEA9656611.1 integrase arm-type DNA-binding domain-containing protein [Xanthomonas campestris pv. raphani]